MSAETQVTITLEAGTTWRYRLVLRNEIIDPDTGQPVVDANGRKVGGDPMDLTGATARFHVRDTQTRSATLLASVSEADGITIGGEDPTDGILEIVLSAEQTDAIGWNSDTLKPRKKAFADLKVTLGTDVIEPFQVMFEIDPTVTFEEPTP